MESELQRVVWRPPTHAVIAGRDVLVQLWETASPSEGMRAVKAWCEERRQREGDRPLFMMSVVGEGGPMPDGEARAIASEFPAYFTEFVMVVEGSGFRASAVRAVLAGMALVAPRRTAPTVVTSVHEGCVALARQSGGVVDATRLEAAIDSARRAIRGLPGAGLRAPTG